MSSILLMMAAGRWNEFSTYSHYLSRLVWPVIYVVSLPDHFVEKSQLFLQDRNELVSEKNDLAQQQIHLQVQVQKLRALEAENLELRELLRSMSPKAESFSEARLMQVDLDPFSQQILLNKGKRNQVENGQPVIDAHGLVGIVLAADLDTSRVLLVSDPSFAVPVQSVRSGERAIATGSGTGGELRLNYVPRTANFMEGDQLVTSGLGGKFPAGYPVGTITSIQDDVTTRFTLIGVSPAAKLGQMRHVLLLKHHPAAIHEEEEPIEQAKKSSPLEVVQITKSVSNEVLPTKPLSTSDEALNKVAEKTLELESAPIAESPMAAKHVAPKKVEKLTHSAANVTANELPVVEAEAAPQLVENEESDDNDELPSWFTED